MNQPEVESGSNESRALEWRELMAAGRYAAARNAYLVGDGENQDVRATLNALADISELLRERSFNRALERLARLEEFAPTVDIAEIETELAAFKEAGAALDRREPEAARELMLALNSDWFESERLTQLGTTYVYDSNLEEAERHFLKAVELDPQHYRALTNLGNVALERGEVDQAIELYEQALKIDDQFPNAHHNLGVAYRKKGQLAKSVRSLRRAQRTQQRHDVAEARESLGKWAGPNTARYFKWGIWALIIVAGYFLLRAAGYLG